MIDAQKTISIKHICIFCHSVILVSAKISKFHKCCEILC